jgi:long-subunit fatty acid transport protein
MRFRLLILLVIAIASVGAQERSIGHFAGVGARAMGMGGAYVGVADDFTAVFWNPAGLVQKNHYEIQVSFARNSQDTKATLNSTSASAALNNTRFGALGLVYPVPVYQGRLVFAAGFNRVQDFDSIIRIQGFDQVDSLQTTHQFSHEGGLTMTSLAGAIDISPTISLGLSLNILSGEDENRREFDWTDSEDIYTYQRLVAREKFSDDYRRSYSAIFGIMVRTPRIEPKFRGGFTIAARTTQRVSYIFEGLPADPDIEPYNQILFDDGSSENFANASFADVYKISLPLEFGTGASYRLRPDLLLSGSAHFAEWTQSEYDENDNFRADADFDDQYKDIWRYHFGAEWQVPTFALDLRAGFYTDPLPFVGPRDPTEPVDPLINPIVAIKQDRRFLTLGAGLVVDQILHVDLAWSRGTFEQVEGNLTEDNTTNRTFVGLSYRF